MPNLKWDETDFLVCLETIPEIEEYEVSHSYKVTKSGITLSLKVWQHESIVEIALINNNDGNEITSFAIFINGTIQLKTIKEAEYLTFSDSIVIPSRFSYLDLGGIDNLETGQIGYDVYISIKPTIQVTFPRLKNN